MLFIRLGLFFITNLPIEFLNLSDVETSSKELFLKYFGLCGLIWKSEMPLCGGSCEVGSAQLAYFLLNPSLSHSVHPAALLWREMTVYRKLWVVRYESTFIKKLDNLLADNRV